MTKSWGRPFKKGQSGNPAGSKRATTTLRQWWNWLLREDDQGKPKYTVADIWLFAEAENNDPNISPAKRIAARHIIEAVEGGSRGIEVVKLIFDRTEGKPAQSIHMSGSLVADPAAEVTRDTLSKIREAANGSRVRS